MEWNHNLTAKQTRKLCYRKDDRMMPFYCAIRMQYRYDPAIKVQRKQRGVADAVPKQRTKGRHISSLPKISPCSWCKLRDYFQCVLPLQHRTMHVFVHA